MNHYYVHIMSSVSGVLYVGMTNHLERRVYEHKIGEGGYFTKKYKARVLVHFEETGEADAATNRERQLHKYSRKKKVELITKDNPESEDLSAGWYDEESLRLGAY